DVVSLIGGASLMQGHELAARPATTVAIDQRRKVLTVKPGCGGIHDHNTLDHDTQFPHVPGPGVAHQGFDCIVGNFARATTVMPESSRRKWRARRGISSLRSRKGGTEKGITFSR